MGYDHLAFALTCPGQERADAIGIPVGFPLLHLPDGTLCELAFCVFDWLDDVRRLRSGTLWRLAFDLREWLAFCLWRGWDAEEPNDQRLAAWRAFLVDPLGGGLDAGIAEQKVARVFGMYVNLHRAMPVRRDGPRASVIRVVKHKKPSTDLLAVLCDDGLVDEVGRDEMVPAVAEVDGGAADTLTARRVGKGLRWTGAGKRKPRGPQRPIPTERQAREVMERLRSGVAAEGVAGYPKHLADRDWLAGRSMEGAGCRAIEVSGVCLDAIEAMLRADGLLAGIVTPAGRHLLDELASDPAAWRVLLDGIEGLEAAGRTTMSLSITGKNGKIRMAPVGFDLVRDLLEVGVASVRPTLLAQWRSAGWRGEAPTGLFLSSKTKAAIQEGSISELMTKAFAAYPTIPGSGHRVRAAYAVTTAIRIFDACLARFGGQMSPAMVQAAHAELAAALGHESISTTVAFYLDMARVYHLHARKHGDRVLEIIQQEVANAPDRLTSAKLLVLRRTVRALLQSELGSEYMELLDLLPEEADLRSPVIAA